MLVAEFEHSSRSWLCMFHYPLDNGKHAAPVDYVYRKRRVKGTIIELVNLIVYMYEFVW